MCYFDSSNSEHDFNNMKMINKTPGRETMDFDQLLHHIGHFGTYQKIRILLLMLGPICGGIAVTSFIFTGNMI